MVVSSVSLRIINGGEETQEAEVETDQHFLKDPILWWTASIPLCFKYHPLTFLVPLTQYQLEFLSFTYKCLYPPETRTLYHVEEIYRNRQKCKTRQKPVTVHVDCSLKTDTLPACPCSKTDSSAQLAWCCCVSFCTKQQSRFLHYTQSAVGFHIFVLDLFSSLFVEFDLKD